MPYYEIVLGRYAMIGVEADRMQEAVMIAKNNDDMEFYANSDVEVVHAEEVDDRSFLMDSDIFIPKQ